MQQTNNQLAFHSKWNKSQVTLHPASLSKWSWGIGRLFGQSFVWVKHGAINAPQRRWNLRPPDIHQLVGSPPSPSCPHAKAANKIDEAACEILDIERIAVAPTEGWRLPVLRTHGVLVALSHQHLEQSPQGATPHHDTVFWRQHWLRPPPERLSCSGGRLEAGSASPPPGVAIQAIPWTNARKQTHMLSLSSFACSGLAQHHAQERVLEWKHRPAPTVKRHMACMLLSCSSAAACASKHKTKARKHIRSRSIPFHFQSSSSQCAGQCIVTDTISTLKQPRRVRCKSAIRASYSNTS